MSIFGNLNTDEIPDDPFYVPPNTYLCVCTESKVEEVKDSDSTRLVIDWTIDEQDSDHFQKKVREFYLLPPTSATWDQLERAQKQAMTFLKKRLRLGFNMSEEDISNFDEPSKLIGQTAYVTVVERNGKGENANKKYSNVADALSKENYEEQHAGSDLL